MVDEHYDQNDNANEEEDIDFSTFVIDLGSGNIKCGFGGQTKPTLFPNQIGKIKKGLKNVQSKDAEPYIGDEAELNSEICELEYVVTEGIVNDWSNFKLMIKYIIESKARVEPDKCNFLLTEAPNNPAENRINMFKIMLDPYDKDAEVTPGFGVMGVQCQIQAILSLYSSGMITGLVVDSGDGVTHAVPVIKGYKKTVAIGKSKLAGRAINAKLVNLINAAHGDILDNDANKDQIAADVKCKTCYYAMDFDTEMAEYTKDRNLNATYTLKDGSSIKVGQLRIEGPEIMYRAETSLNPNEKNLTTIVKHSYDKSDVSTRLELVNFVLCSGGNTRMEKFGDRLQQEMVRDVTKGLLEVNNHSPPDAMDCVYTGGNILARLSSFEEQWITQEEYAEEGEAVFERKNLNA